MKHKDDEDYVIVSELTKDDGIELTEKQAKIVIAIISLFLIGLVAYLIISYDYKNAKLLAEEQALEEELEEAQTRHAELLAEADELCLWRVRESTCDDVLELETFLFSYQLKSTNDGWTDGKSTLTFDFDSVDSPAILYCDSDGNNWRRKLTRDQNIDDYYAKLGREMLTLSSGDVKALGRVLIGDTSGFTKLELE